MSIPQRNTALVLGVAALLILPFLITAASALGEDFETVDLRDLDDGETRTFGDPDHSMTATRDGDRVVLRFGDEHEGPNVVLRREMVCDLSEDDCTVRIGRAHDGDGAYVVEIKGQDGDVARIDREIRFLGDRGRGGRVLIDVAPRAGQFDFDDDALREHLDRLRIELDSLGERMHDIHIAVPPVAPVAPFLVAPGTGARTLRCPEGDTVMTVDEDDADGTYACPRHGTTLEEVRRPSIQGFQWRFRAPSGDDDAEGSDGWVEL